jgi:hypothetical protein
MILTILFDTAGGMTTAIEPDGATTFEQAKAVIEAVNALIGQTTPLQLTTGVEQHLPDAVHAVLHAVGHSH